MTIKTTAASQRTPADELDAARAEAWEEHQRRCANDEPYTDGVTVEELAERVRAVAPQGDGRRDRRRLSQTVPGEPSPVSPAVYRDR